MKPGSETKLRDNVAGPRAYRAYGDPAARPRWPALVSSRPQPGRRGKRAKGGVPLRKSRRLGRWSGRPLVVSAAIQGPAASTLPTAAPLLEKEGDVCQLALMPDTANPCGIHSPRTRAAFTPDDDPRDSI